jgi:DNA-binding beta-propeller fold protein YncE
MRRIATAFGVVGALVALVAPASAGAAFGPSIDFGGSGAGDGQFSHPQSAAVNLGNGQVYVADTNNARVQVFNASGGVVDSLSAAQDFSPQDVAVDPTNGNVYVASPHRIHVWTSAGVPLANWQPSGVAAAYGIAADGSNHVYVSDTQSSVIQKYSVLLGNPTGPPTAVGAPGTGAGQMQQPKGLTLDSGGNLYVADPSNNRIDVFNSAGTFVRQLAMPSYTVYAGGSTFAGVVHPQDVATDGSGRVFAPDTGTHSNLVAVLGADASVQQLFGSPDSDPGNPCAVHAPWGVATSPSGRLYVVSTGNDLVRTFTESPGPACPAPNFGSPPSQAGGPPNPANDHAAPQITLTGFPRKCARKDFTFTVHVEDDVLINTLALFVNRKRATNDRIDQQAFDFRVHIPVRRVRREIPAGFRVRVLIAVKATDLVGHKTVVRKAFGICG